MPLDGYFGALVLALLPALGNISGGMLAETIHVSQRTLSLALHAAADIVIAVIGIELMPEALDVTPTWIILLAFVADSGFAILVDSFTDFLQSRMGGTEAIGGAWGIYFGVAVDLFIDGVMIGTGSTIDFGLGLLLALGQTPADIPEGFATITTFKDREISRPKRLLLNVVDVQAEAGAFDAGGVTEDYVERLETEGQEATEQLAQHVDDADVTVQESVVRGTSYEAIAEYTAENDIDLIVMASEGESNLASQSLGSVTDRVLRTVDVPVLVIFS